MNGFAVERKIPFRSADRVYETGTGTGLLQKDVWIPPFPRQDLRNKHPFSSL